MVGMEGQGGQGPTAQRQKDSNIYKLASLQHALLQVPDTQHSS
jgi:hypothetical protein